MFKFNFELDDNEANKISKAEDLNINTDTEAKKANHQDDLDHDNFVPSFGIYKYDQLNESIPKQSKWFRVLNLNRNYSQVLRDLQDQEEDEAQIEENPQGSIEYIDSTKVELDENDVLSKINKTHDLVSGQYEGGLKIWELSIDLARFIYNLSSFEVDLLNSSLDEATLGDLRSIKGFFNSFKCMEKSDEKKS